MVVLRDTMSPHNRCASAKIQIKDVYWKALSSNLITKSLCARKSSNYPKTLLCPQQRPPNWSVCIKHENRKSASLSHITPLPNGVVSSVAQMCYQKLVFIYRINVNQSISFYIDEVCYFCSRWGCFVISPHFENTDGRKIHIKKIDVVGSIMETEV